MLKPDISHLDTWPNIFNKDTVMQYKWDLSDLSELVEKILNNYDDYIEFAIKLQDQYKYYSFGRLGEEKFCKYLSTVKKLMKKIVNYFNFYFCFSIMYFDFFLFLQKNKSKTSINQYL